ncbi:hypothetical protein ACIQKB_04135 [Streptomyces sp. NPDC092046]|uniref:hypothetical protein n=1 Tax=Streptomyces sp. NPDC092046 TaxID=3366009 RepID=UPI0038274420
MNARRLTLTYWPAHHTLGHVRPAITLNQKPDPNCPDCDGSGYTATWHDCRDETPCHCTPNKDLATLPLPRSIGRAMYRHWERQARTPEHR